MTQKEADQLEHWFIDFSSRYNYAEDDRQRSVELKREHTRRVAADMRLLADAVPDADVTVAYVIGLLHDVGRFPQFDTYNTFLDSKSINHGELGARTLTEQGVLDELPSLECDIIFTSVKYHNAFAVPRIDNPAQTLYLRLIRDADKLDVWRVLSEHYAQDEDERSPVVSLGLSESSGCSQEVLSHFRRVGECRSNISLISTICALCISHGYMILTLRRPLC